MLTVAHSTSTLYGVSALLLHIKSIWCIMFNEKVLEKCCSFRYHGAVLNYLLMYFCAALPLATPFSLSLFLMISQLYSDPPCFICQEPSLLLEPLPALALPLVLLLVVLLLSFFVCMKILPSVQQLSPSQQLPFLLLMTFLMIRKSWTLNLTLSYFWMIFLIYPASPLLSTNYVPCA